MQPRAEAVCPPRGGQGPPTALSPAQLPGHGRTSGMASLLVLLSGRLLHLQSHAGFLQIFSERRVGGGGLGEVNQSSTAGDKGL